MLNDLRKLIESENRHDEELDLMMEATSSDIMDMFIEEDGEADIPEEEVMSILNKIPAYDEDAVLNKKLDRITENYIPEDL